MELKEYIAIFKKQAATFWMVVVVIVFVTTLWQQNQVKNLQATLLLNIGRSGMQNTQNYTYDSFYRLQADERFADTVVRWLASPRVVEDIALAAGMDASVTSTRGLQTMFGAKRLSSQMIEVTYQNADAKVLQKISEAVVTVLNEYTESLNKENRETNWFVVIGSDPVIRDARITFSLAVAVGLTLGAFIGFWVALMRHYFVDSK